VPNYPLEFCFAGVHCGLKPARELDLAMFASTRSCTAAGVFTTNQIKAAPVVYDQELLQAGGQFRAVVANSGNANACTGDTGNLNARQMAAQAAERLACIPEEVLVLSTGVIGVQLPMGQIRSGIGIAVQELAPDGAGRAARAIMTTDTRPKMASRRSEQGFSITGFAKGSGMIAPHMATMLAILLTDAEVAQPDLQSALEQAVSSSFNRIVVDGDMSTNDTVLLLANGASNSKPKGLDWENFCSLLGEVCSELAQSIVRDGEGASKFIEITVSGAPDSAAATQIGRSIATSALCKTAFYGADPNWGRVLCAAGYAGVPFKPSELALWLVDLQGSHRIQLVSGGEPAGYDEQAAAHLMQQPEWGLQLDLGQGNAESICWTCDLSEEYIQINSHYRT
jgi:glutamate N-acetyltransferase/amino-acid N-acetyltransferase